MKKVNVIYIDDSEEELEKYKKKFEKNNKAQRLFKIIPIQSQELKRDEISTLPIKGAALVLMDYDLSYRSSDEKTSPFFGISLATGIKQKFFDVPIILFMRRGIFIQYQTIVKKYPNVVIDIILKRNLFRKKEKLDYLYNLAMDFYKLSRVKNKGLNKLLELLKVPKEDSNSIKLANPPLNKKGLWSVSEISKWIRKILLAYPGILYDPIHAATFLGLSKKSFLKKEVQKFFKDAKYEGVFAPADGRWWKSKLQKIALSIVEIEMKAIPIRKSFPESWENKKGRINKSKCVFSRKSPAEWVCCILKKPIMLRYSLPYHKDNRPVIMDEARISYKAIRESNEINDDFLDLADKPLLKKIRNKR